jgi:predicted RND superfamily exporter protein
MFSFFRQYGTSEFFLNIFFNRPLRLIIIFSAILLFGFWSWSASEARKNTSNRVVDWLPEGTPELKMFLDDYYKIFPEGELLMVSWKNCTEQSTVLDDVAAALTAPAPNSSELNNTDEPYFQKVLTTRSVLNSLTGEPLNLSKNIARNRLDRWLLGRNEKDACLIAMISPAGSARRLAAIEYIFHIVQTKTGLERSDIYVAGPSIDSVAIDVIATNSQKTLLPFFITFCFILLLVCLRNFFAAGIVLFVALMNEELSGALLYWTNAHVDSISMLISSLIYVLTISAGIHLINYYRESAAEGDTKTAALKMLHKAFLPCLLAMLTTVLGFVSLMCSKMIPVRTFGIYASLALFIGTTWLFIFLCAYLQQFPIKQWAVPLSPAAGGTRFWQYWAMSVKKFNLLITVLSIASMFVFAFGVQHLQTTVTFHGMLPSKNKVIQDYEKLEGQFSGLIPVEVVLRIPKQENETKTLMDELYLVRDLRNTIGQAEGVDAVVSALNFAPILPQLGAGLRDVARRNAINGIFRRNPNLLENPGFYSQDENYSYWRLSLRTSSQYPNGYDTLLAKINEQIDTVKQTEAATSFRDLHFTVTGGVPLVHRAQTQLLTDLINSFTSAFALITLTMIVMLRGIVRGLLAMIPNIFPCVLVFGAMGFWNISVDMGSMMTASVAMGIAVDGTLHFLTWFQNGLKQGLDRQDSVFFAFRNCGTALIQSTVICGFGMLVFGVSEFIPIARFAVLLCILLIVSLIGDIIVFPAVLYSPLGKFFNKRYP